MIISIYIYTQHLQLELHAKLSCLAEIRLILRAQRDKGTHQSTTCGPEIDTLWGM